MKTPSKLLKTSKDLGHQYMDFVQLFQKKLKDVSINDHPRKELLQQYKQQNFTHSPKEFHDSKELTCFGGFENSNILAVSQENLELNILLSSDTNSNGCTQWFYFGVKVKQQMHLKIRILNNRRAKSLLHKNNHVHVLDGERWQQEIVKEVFYFKTNINHPFYHHQDQKIAAVQSNYSLFTLEFNHYFQQTDGIVYFAFSLPYTIAMLHKSLNVTNLKKKSICQSKLGLPIYQLKTRNKAQTAIVFLARQHPSETAGSFVCEEILKLLNADHPIQKKYRIIIYPMLNPDGVFLGNSRCNFNGMDLNRRWENPNQTSEPEVFYVQKSLQKYQIAFLIDLHGHSRKLNQFIYGCSGPIDHIQQYVEAKQFCKLLSQENHMFSYKDCAFSITPDRMTTARVAMYKKLRIQNSMTIETSVFGYEQGGKEKGFQSSDFVEMGRSILDALFKYDLKPAEFEQAELNRVQNLLNCKSGYAEKESDSDSDAEQDIIPYKPARQVNRRDSTPTQCVQTGSCVKIKPQSKDPIPNVVQSNPFFRKSDQSYSFKRIPTNSTKRMQLQVQNLSRNRSRMNSFQSSNMIEDSSPTLPTIHKRQSIRGAIDLIHALQVKSLFNK